jgi:hypothetical protein
MKMLSALWRSPFRQSSDSPEVSSRPDQTRPDRRTERHSEYVNLGQPVHWRDPYAFSVASNTNGNEVNQSGRAINQGTFNSRRSASKTTASDVQNPDPNMLVIGCLGYQTSVCQKSGDRLIADTPLFYCQKLRRTSGIVSPNFVGVSPVFLTGILTVGRAAASKAA